MDVYIDSKPAGARGAVVDSRLRDRKHAIPALAASLEDIASELRACPAPERLADLCVRLRAAVTRIESACGCEQVPVPAPESDDSDPGEPDPALVAEAVAVLAAVESSAPPAVSRKRKTAAPSES